jgi:hypothetical protein
LKNTSGLWLTALFVLLMLAFGSMVRAQTLNVGVTSEGTQSLTAGSNFSNGGTITVTASGVPSGATVSITSVTLSVGNAGVFNSLTLNGSAPGGSSDASLPLTSSSNVASFSSIQLSDGQSATFLHPERNPDQHTAQRDDQFGTAAIEQFETGFDGLARARRRRIDAVAGLDDTGGIGSQR